MHIRRGDARERWAEGGDGRNEGVGRPCYSAAVYWAQAADIVARLLALPQSRRRQGEHAAGISLRLLVATDSAAALTELRDAIVRDGPPGGVAHVVVEHLALDRDSVGGADGANVGKRNRNEVGRGGAAARYIEERRAAGEVPLELALGSLLADLELLSRADAFVGTSASWVSRLALLAIIGEQAAIPPFALLDAPFLCVWCT